MISFRDGMPRRGTYRKVRSGNGGNPIGSGDPKLHSSGALVFRPKLAIASSVVVPAECPKA